MEKDDVADDVAERLKQAQDAALDGRIVIENAAAKRMGSVVAMSYRRQRPRAIQRASRACSSSSGRGQARASAS